MRTSVKLFLIIFIVAGTVFWYYFSHTRKTDGSPLSRFAETADNASADRVPPASPPPASELRGRRGIIKQIFASSFTVEPTDSHATKGEILEVQTDPSTTYVLVTIHAQPRADGQPLTRTALSRSGISVNDDVFIVSNYNIMSLSRIKATRIEKIVTP